LFIQTSISREIQWKIQTKLLELPCTSNERQSNNEALLQEIFKDSKIHNQLISTIKVLAPHANNKEVIARIEDVLDEYTGSRVAASDITVSLITAATGLIALNKITPGLASLSNSVATGLTNSTAIHSFWGGSWAGGVYYSIVPASVPGLFTAGIFTSILVPASFIATFSGILTDPIQNILGLHNKRLNKLIETTEDILLGI
jgi:hypothetical protein